VGEAGKTIAFFPEPGAWGPTNTYLSLGSLGCMDLALVQRRSRRCCRTVTC
jgi:hypothetical protein